MSIMKVCPICDRKFDEDVIRFCTKDGTPLVDVAVPNFVEMPSANIEEPEDDIGEITIIRRKEVVPPPPSIDELNAELRSTQQPQPERIVIPTSPREQVVRPNVSQAYYPPPQPSNTLKVVALTVFGTIAVLGIGAALFWFLQKDKPSNSNVNLNTNLGTFNGNLNPNNNLNNFNFNASPNFNTGANVNTNFNTNANIKTPTPTPKPSPSPSASPSPSTSASPTPTVTPRPTMTVRPSPSPTMRTGPRPTPNPDRTPN